MKVKLEFLYQTALTPVEADVKEFSIYFLRHEATGTIYDVGVKLGDTIHHGIHAITISEEGEG